MLTASFILLCLFLTVSGQFSCRQDASARTSLMVLLGRGGPSTSQTNELSPVLPYSCPFNLNESTARCATTQIKTNINAFGETKPPKTSLGFSCSDSNSCFLSTGAEENKCVNVSYTIEPLELMSPSCKQYFLDRRRESANSTNFVVSVSEAHRCCRGQGCNDQAVAPSSCTRNESLSSFLEKTLTCLGRRYYSSYECSPDGKISSKHGSTLPHMFNPSSMLVVSAKNCSAEAINVFKELSLCVCRQSAAHGLAIQPQDFFRTDMSVICPNVKFACQIKSGSGVVVTYFEQFYSFAMGIVFQFSYHGNTTTQNLLKDAIVNASTADFLSPANITLANLSGVSHPYTGVLVTIACGASKKCESAGVLSNVPSNLQNILERYHLVNTSTALTRVNATQELNTSNVQTFGVGSAVVSGISVGWICLVVANVLLK